MSKYYVVEKGYETGIYDNWTDCQKQVLGFKGAIYKSYSTIEDAKQAFNLGVVYEKKETKINLEPNIDKKNSIVVDGACSGKTSIGEFQIVDLNNNHQMYLSKKFHNATNNIMEFLGLVEALKIAIDSNKIYIYTDSITAIAWVRDKKTNSSTKDANLKFELNNAIEWLKNTTHNVKILKWDTENWGENPADFGRK